MLIREGLPPRRELGMVELYLTPKEAEDLIVQLRTLLANLGNGNAHVVDFDRMNELNVVVPVESNVVDFDGGLVNWLRENKMVSPG